MKKKIKYVFLIIYILIIGVIFLSSLQNSEKSSEESSKVTDVIVDTVETITNDETKLNYDKTHLIVRKVIGHFGSFFLCGIFGLICYYYFVLKQRKAFVISLSCGVIVAIVSELLQLVTDGRKCQVTDMLINFSGYLLSSLIVMLIIHCINKKTYNVSA